MNTSSPNIRTSGWTAALLLGAAVLWSAVSASAAPQASSGPAFLKGRVQNIARPNAGPADRFAAAKAEAIKSGGGKSFFVAAIFPAREKVRFGRNHGGNEPYSVTVDGPEIKIEEKESGNLQISSENDSRTSAPAGWLLLCDGRTGNPIDANILDPDRTYEFDNASVYWLGNAAAAESLSFIETLFRDNAENDVRESLLFILACHDEPRIYDILKKTALEDRDVEIRKNAVFWLGNTGDARSLAGLKEIFRKERDSEIKEQVVFALSLSKDKEALLEMIRIAKDDRDDDVREKAVFWLGQKASAESVKALKDIVQSSTEEDKLKEQAVFAISQLPKDKSVPMLIDIAKSNKSADVRKKAIFWLGQTGDPAALKFFEDILLKK